VSHTGLHADFGPYVTHSCYTECKTDTLELQVAKFNHISLQTLQFLSDITDRLCEISTKDISLCQVLSLW